MHAVIRSLCFSVLAGCGVLPIENNGPSPSDDPMCFAAPGELIQRSADGEACPDAESAIGYSLLGPNVMLLVDRSTSMLNQDKWTELQQLRPYLPAVGARSNLGLSVFPAPDAHACDVVGGEIVPIGEGPTASIQVADALDWLRPGGNTPLAAAIESLASAPGLGCINRDNIVVLLSDGEESCDGDPVAATRKLVDGPAKVELYVIGFSTNGSTDQQLAEVAKAAESTTGPDNFFTASTVDELLGRLFAVTATCTAQLDAAVAADDLVVTLDGRTLQPCTEERCSGGYTYIESSAAVQLEGEDCLALQDGQCHDLAFDESMSSN